ncbi:class II aldolase/adducin family protein [Nocardiaceae bacterium YC2-7]|uniref:Class II aldolase/adducin family protein n=2 Tax=Antrihabitans stalactiti TaxID=2584121 RepID=A0A848KFD9_9NOCA|nr:class II aldolase/adducin family protein [Antrihabitans stalactiti]
MSVTTMAAERARIAESCRRLAGAGLVIGTAGNVSVRVGELVAITATGAAFEGLTEDQVTVVNLRGDVVDGDLAPTSELELHLGLYRNCNAGAIVHTHAPMAVAVGSVIDEIPCVHYSMLSLGGSVRVAPYATFGTQQLADNVHAALADRSAALMANHGAINYASDLDHAVESALLLEWACTAYWRAAAIGKPRALTPEDQAAVIAAVIERRYGTTQSIEAEEVR